MSKKKKKKRIERYFHLVDLATEGLICMQLGLRHRPPACVMGLLQKQKQKQKQKKKKSCITINKRR
jgi:hypothetical protein